MEGFLEGRSRLPLQFRKLPGLGWTATSYFSPGFAVQMISGFGQEHCIKDDPNYQNRHSLCGFYAWSIKVFLKGKFCIELGYRVILTA